MLYDVLRVTNRILLLHQKVKVAAATAMWRAIRRARAACIFDMLRQPPTLKAGGTPKRGGTNKTLLFT